LETLLRDRRLRNPVADNFNTSAAATMPDPIEELQNPGKAKKDFMRYLRHEFITLNFYRAHMLYFIVVIAISSVIVYGVGVTHGPKEYRDDHLTYMNALFLCTSAMTTTGNYTRCFVDERSAKPRQA
jgi:hypothetical protein